MRADESDSAAEERPVRRPPRTVAVTDDTIRVAVIVGCVAVALALAWWIRGRAVEGTALPARPPSGTPVPAPAVGSSPTAGSTPGPTAEVLVDVRGAVVHPGVRRLPTGSRVVDAVHAAGGLRPGKGYGPVNLAAVLVDGQQVVVGRQGPAAASPAPTALGSSTAAPAALLDLNSATPADLESLDGIGPVLAGQIVAWRDSNGPFRSVDDLLDVSGIGEATLAGIRDSVTVR